MWKGFMIAATAFVLGSSAVSAQAPRDRADGPRLPAFSREDADALLDARIAALHAGLGSRLTRNACGRPFEQAYRDLARVRVERVTSIAPPADDPIGSMRRRADAFAKKGAAVKSLADAAAPWQSFDDGQKRRFGLLARPPGPRLKLKFS
jgi:hypothetical protein